jgi:hypothetical protein
MDQSSRTAEFAGWERTCRPAVPAKERHGFTRRYSEREGFYGMARETGGARCRADDFAGASRNLKFMWSLMFLLSCHFVALGSEHGTHRSESVRRPELHKRNRRPACIWCSLERRRTVRWPPSESGHNPRDDGKPFQPFSQHVVTRRRHESLHTGGCTCTGTAGTAC